MGDCISRQAVLDTLDTSDRFMDEERTVENYKALLKECYEVLPPVTPKQKMGRWLLLSDKDLNDPFDFFYKGNAWMNYKCSNCGHKVHNSLKDTQDNRTNYCPNCGTNMWESEGEQ